MQKDEPMLLANGSTRELAGKAQKGVKTGHS